MGSPVNITMRSMRTLMFSFLMIPVLLGLSCGSGQVSRPNVVLLIIDTLRADHLGCYGYRRDTSPGLDSLAAAGLMWERTQAQSSWTLPAVTTILSGLSPRAHGARLNVREASIWMPSPDMPTISTVLGGGGYYTMGFFNVFFLGEEMGFHRGYDRFACNPEGHGAAGSSVDTAIGWLRERPETGEPYLLVLHLYDPHSPYDPPPPYDTLFTGGPVEETGWVFTPNGAVADTTARRGLEALYDGEIAWTDSQLSRLWAVLREEDTGNGTVVIVTADHGEEFLEHGYVEHGRSFYQEITHVPVIISGTGVSSGVRSDRIASQMDLFPTALEIAGISFPEVLPGIELLDDEGGSARSLPASGVNTGPPYDVASMREGPLKLIWNVEDDAVEMYDLDRDPGEMTQIPADSGILASVELYWTQPPSYQAVRSDMEVGPALRDLGYL